VSTYDDETTADAPIKEKTDSRRLAYQKHEKEGTGGEGAEGPKKKGSCNKRT